MTVTISESEMERREKGVLERKIDLKILCGLRAKERERESESFNKKYKEIAERDECVCTKYCILFFTLPLCSIYPRARYTFLRVQIQTTMSATSFPEKKPTYYMNHDPKKRVVELFAFGKTHLRERTLYINSNEVLCARLYECVCLFHAYKKGMKRSF